jgi:hypothetical protein
MGYILSKYGFATEHIRLTNVLVLCAAFSGARQ